MDRPNPPAGSVANAQESDPHAMSTKQLDKTYDALDFIAATIRPHLESAPNGDGAARVAWLDWLRENGANFESDLPVLIVAFASLALDGDARVRFLAALQRMQELTLGEQARAESSAAES